MDTQLNASIGVRMQNRQRIKVIINYNHLFVDNEWFVSDYILHNAFILEGYCSGLSFVFFPKPGSA
jgi:hypothetical protein